MRLCLEEPFPGSLPTRDVGTEHGQGGAGVSRLPDAPAAGRPAVPPVMAAPALGSRAPPAPLGPLSP
eukprot:6690378-Lingulodinium_polyedra.AAC.1